MRRSSALGEAALLFLCACAGSAPSPSAPGPDSPSIVQMTNETHLTDARWAASDELRITIHAYGQEPRRLTSGDDFKPSWSRTGSMLTFFHALRYGAEFAAWKTKLCVIRSDGSGLRELSDGSYADFNPTWTRDGSNLVIFNRYAVHGSDSNDIFLIAPDGQVGDEVRVSNPDNRYEWAFSGLRDGRLVIDRVSWATSPPLARSFLLTPRPGRVGTYEEISRPTTQLWHKLSVSPSETKVAYMLDNDANMSTYNDVVLYWADFDAATRVVSSPVAITDYDPSHVCEYPRWSADESLIIYDSNRSGVYQMYAYRLADRATARISPDPAVKTQFGNFEDLPK